MSCQAGVRIVALASVWAINTSFAADGPAAWAYGFPQPGAPAAPAAEGRTGQAAPDTSPKGLAGSTLEFTLAQIRDGFGPADWFPDSHPKMPEIVAHGRRPDVRACALCHYPNGKGRAENAPIAGYPVAYFIQQMNDFKSGNRKSAEPSETLRDPRSGFIAYTPPGSVKKGEALAASCGTCHDADLKGLGPVPGIAGRSPSYLVRQMYDMQAGARKGLWTPLMTKVV